jgi:formylmethanofuran dehydrogenase subunit B
MSVQNNAPGGQEVILENPAMRIVPHAVCSFCGCTCDDIELHTEGERIVKAKNACSLGESWFTYHTAEAHYPAALINGEPASLEAAIEAAADYLVSAVCPLVYGLSNLTCESQRAAVKLAESLRGIIDNHSSL